jgi:hypothetical protein
MEEEIKKGLCERESQRHRPIVGLELRTYIPQSSTSNQHPATFPFGLFARWLANHTSSATLSVLKLPPATVSLPGDP